MPGTFFVTLARRTASAFSRSPFGIPQESELQQALSSRDDSLFIRARRPTKQLSGFGIGGVPGFAQFGDEYLTRLLPVIQHQRVNHLRLDDIVRFIDISKATLSR